MKTLYKQFAAALIVAIITTVSIFSMSAKSDTKIVKQYKPCYAQADDSTDEDGSGGIGIPPGPKD